jgi:RHS repeat-associated protein
LKTESKGLKRSLLRGRRVGVYPGQYYDPETGLHYNYFRYYNPQTGRYITPDPIGLEGGINLFVYVQGNPINRIDPLGLHWLSGPRGPIPHRHKSGGGIEIGTIA